MTVAPVEMLSGTAQQADIAASKAPSDILQDCFRVKTYVKPDEFQRYGFNPRHAAFPQPYQVASQVTGAPWTETNRVFLAQLAACNIDCGWCYRSDFIKPGVVPRLAEREMAVLPNGSRVVGITPGDLAQAFLDYNEANPTDRAGVLRASGGEPFLYQEWLTELASETWLYDIYLWVDTNGTIPPTEDLLNALGASGANKRVGVCLCFKPGVSGVDLDAQCRVARSLVDAGVDTYYYWPSEDGGQDLGVHLYRMQDMIHPNSPLRLTVIGINQYATNSGRYVSGDLSPAKLAARRAYLTGYCEARCEPSLLGLPSHQVPQA